jgi:hypothetical protein
VGSGHCGGNIDDDGGSRMSRPRDISIGRAAEAGVSTG